MTKVTMPRGHHEYDGIGDGRLCEMCGHPDRSPAHKGMEANYPEGYAVGAYRIPPKTEEEE